MSALSAALIGLGIGGIIGTVLGWRRGMRQECPVCGDSLADGHKHWDIS